MMMHKMLTFFIFTSDTIFLKCVIIVFREEKIRSGIMAEICNVHKMFIILIFKYIRKCIRR